MQDSREPPTEDTGHPTLAGGEDEHPTAPSESRPQLPAASVILSIDPDGRLGEGVRLQDLDPEPALPKISAGSEKYQVLSLLGRGGMGKVFLVYDRDLKRKVALKMIHEPTGERQARFLEEAQIQGQLEHPNILPVHELGLTDGKKPFYTMPVVRGRTLQQVLHRLGRGDERIARSYSISRLIQVFLQVAQAVEYAHAKGVLHRDLKPANVMLGEHGEVQLLDWGLSRLTAGRPGAPVSPESGHTQEGRVVGTPAYMSPEQSSSLELDRRCDVYSLGVMLYEMLTLSLPFAGDSAQLIRSHMTRPPEAPRLRAPHREIPLALERVCLKAMEKRREDRHGSVAELIEPLQDWLEAEADRARRHQLAEDRAGEGAARLESYRGLRGEVKRLEEETAALGERFKSWQSVAEKAPLHRSARRLEQVRDELLLQGSEVVGTLTEALGFEGDNPTALRLLADYYWDLFAEAEAAGDRRHRDAYGKLVARFDEGRYRHALEGTGTLALTSTPPGAEAWLCDFVERDLQLEPRELRRLGTTPIAPFPIAMGSWLVLLKLPGFRDVRYPVHIARNGAWEGNVTFHTEDEIGAAFVHVPAGPYLSGGEEGVEGRVTPRVQRDLPDFFIGRDPVTMAEYVEFLNDLALRDADLALKRSPRHGPAGTTYLLCLEGGGLALPDVDADGDRWDPSWPVFLVSTQDAAAYCAWRSEREGRVMRLPTASEWEKAARGVDGRTYPWGDHFDPSLCNLRESRRGRPSPVAIGEFPADVSVYGVRGMAGNVQDWTASEVLVGEGEEARPSCIVCGGGWDSTAVEARVGRRTWNGPFNVTHMTGFRVVRLPRPR